MRACVVCHEQFRPEYPEQWACSGVCAHILFGADQDGILDEPKDIDDLGHKGVEGMFDPVQDMKTPAGGPSPNMNLISGRKEDPDDSSSAAPVTDLAAARKKLEALRQGAKSDFAEMANRMRIKHDAIIRAIMKTLEASLLLPLADRGEVLEAASGMFDRMLDDIDHPDISDILRSENLEKGS